MSFTSAVIFSVVLLYISRASASAIPDEKTVEQRTSKEFDVHIRERGTKFVQKIEIDEEKGLEYFHVPAHNGLTEADFLYDFESAIAVRRVKSEASCYVGPLPDKLPKPAILKTGLQRASQTSPSGQVSVEKYWAVTEKVNKSLLREEVQDFCGQFPIYRLREYHLDSARNAGRTRLARAPLWLPPLCKRAPFPRCNPESWRYDIQVRKRHCTYWVTGCRFNEQAEDILCEKWDHDYNSMICYKVSCP